MVSRTLLRYFGMRFLGAVFSIFFGIFLLIVLVDYIELTRRVSDIPNLSAWTVAKTSFLRVPQLTERLLPFSVLVGAMTCYLALSRRNELVVARAAGMSAWQFVAPALIAAFGLGIFATVVYNPLSAIMREASKRLEAEMFGDNKQAMMQQQSSQGFWVRQKSVDGQSIIYATSSQEQGVHLDGVSVFTFDPGGRALERIEAKRATLEPGHWRLDGARVYASGKQPREFDTYQVKTNLTSAQVRESFSTPETVPFWDLPAYIEIAERSGLVAAGYKFQYHVLIARPFLLTAMVLLACSVSLRFFRFGGVPRMVLSGISAGFLLYVLSKVTEDLSKAELLNPALAAWLPVLAGGLTGFIVLLYQEDG
jgi:lipopolysaccharide export system permease protein